MILNQYLGLRSIYCYKLKGVGSPEYYSGADIANAKKEDNTGKQAPRYTSRIFATKLKRFPFYLKHDIYLKMYGPPHKAGDHPKKDETESFYPDQIYIYAIYI